MLQSVVRGYRVFFSLSRSARGRPLAQISAETGLHKSTTVRLLQSLMAERMVMRDPASGLYLQDPGFWLSVEPYAQAAFAYLSAVQDVLEHLAQATKATAMVLLPEYRPSAP